ncbi:ArsR family transcriptional regulator [Hyphomicrobium methylovorum]|uniref:ArsR/SmtB family transcription factor n=1 Tax=Hyphomicrobium methylovorum TaxID=84 RepID=UPI0015E7B597|nr:metalloregulator ArsR/SmtB family transcription factor [Hyphomicrobium methylovorum]MBA2124813.1 ArsR family transcriptional regulator [Hyphomicrobium methylovorum]
MPLSEITTPDLVTALKAAAEPTRLRILLLLAGGELNVKDLTLILGQSQPRISRHLKLLCEAGLIERFREGSWVYFHISDRQPGGRLALRLFADVDPSEPAVRRDRERAEALKKEREASAQTFFEKHAADWDRIRSMHVAEREVESAMLEALGPGPFRFLLDLGTGTGRTLELFSDRFERGLGIDVNQAMLAYARANLKTKGCQQAQVRHGDIYALSLADRQADAVVMHQILHFLSDPSLAIREAARVLAPGGKLLIVDFAPHELEFLRTEEAHERLGFSHDLIAGWLRDSGLVVRQVRDLTRDAVADADILTVTMWMAERPADPFAKSTATADIETLEEAS